MEKLIEQFQRIPWASFGRTTLISKLAASVLPVGNFPQPLPSLNAGLQQELGDENYEDHLMDIQGTAFQVGQGKLLTCLHVCEALATSENRAYVQTTHFADGIWYKRYWPIVTTLGFIDPRTNAGNSDVDIGIIISPGRYDLYGLTESPTVRCADSAQAGVGDRVLIGGYPLGLDMFLATATNRGVIQPSFYDGVISAIIPASRENETRLLQISSVALGGISGGVVCNEKGRVLGMVTSGLTTNEGTALPITYAIPSEVLRPWSEAVTYRTANGILR